MGQKNSRTYHWSDPQKRQDNGDRTMMVVVSFRAHTKTLIQSLEPMNISLVRLL